MFAYSWPGRRPGSKVWNGLHYICREPPFQTAKLIDEDYTIDFAAVTTPSDRVAVITTKPLTDEVGWTEFQRGQLIMFDNGTPHFGPESCESVELQGRGLYSKCFGKKCQTKTTTVTVTPATEMATTELVASPSAGITVEEASAALQVAAAAAVAATRAACIEAHQTHQQSTTSTTTGPTADFPPMAASKVC